MTKDGLQIILHYDSQIVYKKNDSKSIRLTGGFYKTNVNGSIGENFNNIIINTSPGDKVENRENKENQDELYNTNIIFINNENLNDRNYIIKHYPNLDNKKTNMTVEVNFNDITRHLVLQRVINNYYIVSGILFMLTGIFLCFFGFYQKIAKVIVSIIFGELITFIILAILIEINIKYLEFLFIIIGIIIGVPISYYSIKYLKIYRIFLSLTSGIIFGIILVDIIFIYNCHQLILSIFIDNIILSSISFLIILKVVKKYYIFLNSIIGGYILIRGISILAFKKFRYRELQLIIYFMIKFEWEYFEKDKETLNIKLYWLYDILIFLCIIISCLFYYFHSKYYNTNTEEIEEDEIEEKNELEDKVVNLNENEGEQ